ncbi:MAG TPA: universal stress protein [Nocardioidaceae bacterium]|nr:universal stress protein [Nocardioidaceae bacterium]
MCTGPSRGFIVVGVDDRPESLNAARYAIDLARASGLCVRLLHAYGSIIGYGQYGVLHAGRMERTARAIIDRVAAELEVPDGQCVERVVDGRSPVDALTAAGSDARCVVIGRRDRQRAPRLVRGQVASRLSGKAPVPIITVPASWRQPERPSRPVVIGLDGRTRARRPLAFAFTFAEQMGVGLEVVHVIDHDGEPIDRGDDRAAISQILTQWRARHPTVAVDVQIVRGAAVETLTRFSAEASLLVVGKSYEYPGFGVWVGALGCAVLKQSSCPVAIVPQVLADTHGAVTRTGDDAAPIDTSARS